MIANKPVIPVTLIETLQALKADIYKNMNCVKPGQIQSFNPTKKTATVQILFKRLLGDGVTIIDYPVLIDCPVFTLQGGGACIQFPIAAGDQCIVLFADNNIDAWFQNGGSAVPFDDRAHDLADGIALVGINSLASAMPAYQANKLVISYGGAAITFQSGQISFDGTSGEATIAAIGNLVKIANATTTLLTLLNGFIDVIATVTVQGPGTYPLTAAAIATLEAYKLQLATLLL